MIFPSSMMAPVLSRRPWTLLWACALLACEGEGARSARPQAVPAADTQPAPASGPMDPDLPGVAHVDSTLTRQLRSAAATRSAARSGATPARTRHLRPDGSPRYVNRLVLESSPYLQQHAFNPVNFFPWGPEAFRRARAAGKPIFLSIGYSTCHWCHVMEQESFDDVEIARLINAHFIAIKVDREQRPDIDAIYMRAVQMLTGRGGWPLTVVMTPEGEPFFGGTYFPPRDGERGSRKGLASLLRELSARYAEAGANVVDRARRITAHLRKLAEPAPPGDIPQASLLEQAAEGLAHRYDAEAGGFGSAPKFPEPGNLTFLLRHGAATGDSKWTSMAVDTLRAMARGGIFDQVGGGFHRYATDREWRIPHFEKMLYDNAQLASVYLEAFQATGSDDLGTVARRTLDYMAHGLGAANGGFYSATDADSPSPSGKQQEGRFFTWTRQELETALGAGPARAVAAYYGVTEQGDLEGRSVLHVTHDLDRVAADLGLSPAALQASVESARAQLARERAKRPPPPRDEKILTAWNGLAISAFARAGFALDEPAYLKRAAAAADFVLRERVDGPGRLLRGENHAAVLDDHAFLIQGLLDLYEASSDPRWLRAAIAQQAEQDKRFADPSRGGYFLTGDDRESLLVRDKPLDDGALPSGNSVAADNLLRLWLLTGEAAYRVRAERCFAAFARDMGRLRPSHMLAALERYLGTPREIALVVPPDDAGAGRALRDVLRTYYAPHNVQVTTSEAELATHAALVPWLAHKTALRGKATAYVCERGRCERPAQTPRALLERLAPSH